MTTNMIASLLVVIILALSLFQSWIIMMYDGNDGKDIILDKYKETAIFSVIIVVLSLVVLTLLYK